MAILQDHHIIPQRFADDPALRDLPFDIQAPSNRIFLPADTQLAADMGVSAHNGGHPVYNEGVRRTLVDLENITDPNVRLGEVSTLQEAMRVALANGDLYAKPSAGKTPDQMKLINDRFFGDWRG